MAAETTPPALTAWDSTYTIGGVDHKFAIFSTMTTLPTTSASIVMYPCETQITGSTAPGPTTTNLFLGATMIEGFLGPALDNIQVKQVPEPASGGLCGLMAIVGLFVDGRRFRQRKYRDQMMVSLKNVDE